MDPLARLSPEQRARVRIDEMLEKAGWKVRDYAAPNINAATGVAVREFVTPLGRVDYLLADVKGDAYEGRGR